MAPSFLILHGIGNHRPPAHWQFQLAAALAADGSQVLYPSLPDTDEPRFDAWAEVLYDQLRRLEGDERTVVCHSLACLLWMAAAPDLAADLRPERVLLVSPPAAERVPEEGANFRRDSWDGDAIGASARREIRIAASDNDPYNPRGAEHVYARPLGIDSDLIPGAGHITPDDGYGPWPAALAWCRGEADALAPKEP